MATFTNETLKRLITSLDTLQNPPADSNRRRSFSTTHFATISDEPSSRSSKLQSILHAFPAKPSRTDLESIVQSLSKENDREDGSAGGGEQDERIAGLARSDSEEDELLLEWTVVARAVLGLYGQTVDELVRRAGVWEDEIGWWKRLETRGRWSWRGIGGYLIQTTPQRLSSLSLNLVQSRSESRSSSESSSNSFTPTYLLSTLFPLASLPRSASSSSPSPLAASAFSPNKLSTPFLKSIHGPRTLLRLTKLEVKTRIAELEKGRDRLVAALGELVVKAPSFSPKEKGKATSTSGGRLEEDGVDTARLGEELLRIVGLLYATDDRERLSSTSFQSSSSNLLDSPKAYLPLLAPLLSQPHPIPTPPFHLTRPTALTRLWVPALLIPLLVPLLSPYIPVLREAVVNGRETLLGFWNGWVVEPVMGILNTVRHGGGSGESGLSVMSKEGMKSDMDSLERMVVDLAKDKRNYTPEQLNQLTMRVREGDLSDVMALYESDIKSPLKSAIAGSLVRSLLIQVQKTKVDVDLALSGIDKLLRSQELTFAFVGVAPSFLIVYLLGGWLRGSGIGLLGGVGGRSERRRKSWEGIRRIERLLTLPPPPSPAPTSDQATGELPYEIQGLLLLSISDLRNVAKKEFKRSEGAQKTEFLLDLLDLENPDVNRDAKLLVVERMWRCWSVRLGWSNKSPN